MELHRNLDSINGKSFIRKLKGRTNLMVVKSYITVSALELKRSIAKDLHRDIEVCPTLFNEEYYNDTYKRFSLVEKPEGKDAIIIYNYLRTIFPNEQSILIDTSW